MRIPVAVAVAVLALGLAPPTKAAAAGARVDPRLLDAAAGGSVAAFVHFDERVDLDVAVDGLDARGVGVSVRLPAAHAVAVYGPASAVLALSRDPGVTLLEHAGAEPVAMASAGWVTRARTLYEPTAGLDLRVPAPGGGAVDGRGVGIAVIDTGVDGTHPDLRWRGLDGDGAKLARNYKVTCGNPLLDADEPLPPRNGCHGVVVMEELPHTDATSGHGTHVAGIAAGSGAASDGLEAGVAPGATLYGFSAGEGRSILTSHAAAAMQWIYDHGHLVQPPIRVVNNSYGSTGAHDPEFVLSKLTNALVSDRGVTMVFAAGNGDTLNDGGDGSDDRTSRHAKNPTPGVLGVANYDEATGELAPSSSRGHRADPSTWPDLSAPGSLITAPCAATSAICITRPPWYTGHSGTSMAAPHVAGVAALLYQVAPGITPAEVEYRLESTARRFAAGAGYEPDPAHPDEAPSSFDKGHGLVDARRAVLRTLGLRDDFGVEPERTASRELTVDDPADDSVGFGASDLLGVDVTELDDGALRFELTVRDADDLPPNGTVDYAVVGSISARGEVRNYLYWDGSAVTSSGSWRPRTTGRDGNTFFAEYAPSETGGERGDVLAVEWVATYEVAVRDTAPGSLLEWETNRPHFEEYVLSGPLPAAS